MKTIRRIGLVLIVLFVLVGITELVSVPSYERDNIWRSRDQDVLVMAHAGGRKMHPGNTMRAMQYSFDLGVDVLEMDVQMTSDDILVLRHGENETGNIRAMSNCDGLLYEMTYQEAYEQCNFGYHFMDQDGLYPYRDMTFEQWVEEDVYLTKLSEIFETFGGDILYNIEIKADLDADGFKMADVLASLIIEYELEDHVLVATAFDDISAYLVRMYPSLYISASLGEAREMVIKTLSFRNFLYQPEAYAALQLPVSYEFPVVKQLDLTMKRIVRFTHKHNMAMHYWTINDAEEMKRLIQAGADGIITDDPALLIEVLEEMHTE